MKKGITPVIAIIILLLIAIAVVGMGYGFITGVFTSITGTAGTVPGVSSCASGAAAITITNVGSGNISIGTDTSGVTTGTPNADVSITRTSGGPPEFPNWTATDDAGTPCSAGTTCNVGPGNLGMLKESTTFSYECGAGTCTYDVFVGGTRYQTRVNC